MNEAIAVWWTDYLSWFGGSLGHSIITIAVAGAAGFLIGKAGK